MKLMSSEEISNYEQSKVLGEIGAQSGEAVKPFDGIDLSGDAPTVVPSKGPMAGLDVNQRIDAINPIDVISSQDFSADKSTDDMRYVASMYLNGGFDVKTEDEAELMLATLSHVLTGTKNDYRGEMLTMGMKPYDKAESKYAEGFDTDKRTWKPSVALKNVRDAFNASRDIQGFISGQIEKRYGVKNFYGDGKSRKETLDSQAELAYRELGLGDRVSNEGESYLGSLVRKVEAASEYTRKLARETRHADNPEEAAAQLNGLNADLINDEVKNWHELSDSTSDRYITSRLLEELGGDGGAEIDPTSPMYESYIAKSIWDNNQDQGAMVNVDGVWVRAIENVDGSTGETNYTLEIQNDNEVERKHAAISRFIDEKVDTLGLRRTYEAIARMAANPDVVPLVKTFIEKKQATWGNLDSNFRVSVRDEMYDYLDNSADDEDRDRRFSNIIEAGQIMRLSNNEWGWLPENKHWTVHAAAGAVNTVLSTAVDTLSIPFDAYKMTKRGIEKELQGTAEEERIFSMKSLIEADAASIAAPSVYNEGSLTGWVGQELLNLWALDKSLRLTVSGMAAVMGKPGKAVASKIVNAKTKGLFDAEAKIGEKVAAVKAAKEPFVDEMTDLMHGVISPEGVNVEAIVTKIDDLEKMIKGYEAKNVIAKEVQDLSGKIIDLADRMPGIFGQYAKAEEDARKSGADKMLSIMYDQQVSAKDLESGNAQGEAAPFFGFDEKAWNKICDWAHVKSGVNTSFLVSLPKIFGSLWSGKIASSDANREAIDVLVRAFINRDTDALGVWMAAFQIGLLKNVKHMSEFGMKMGGASQLVENAEDISLGGDNGLLDNVAKASLTEGAKMGAVGAAGGVMNGSVFKVRNFIRQNAIMAAEPYRIANVLANPAGERRWEDLSPAERRRGLNMYSERVASLISAMHIADPKERESAVEKWRKDTRDGVVDKDGNVVTDGAGEEATRFLEQHVNDIRKYGDAERVKAVMDTYIHYGEDVTSVEGVKGIMEMLGAKASVRKTESGDVELSGTFSVNGKDTTAKLLISKGRVALTRGDGTYSANTAGELISIANNEGQRAFSKELSDIHAEIESLRNSADESERAKYDALVKGADVNGLLTRIANAKTDSGQNVASAEGLYIPKREFGEYSDTAGRGGIDIYDGIIFLSGEGREDGRSTLRHETVHAVLDALKLAKVLTEQDVKDIESKYTFGDKEWEENFVDDFVSSAKAADDKAIEAMGGAGFGEFTNQDTRSLLGKVVGGAKKLLGLVKNTQEAMKRNDGVRYSLTDFIESKIRSAEEAQREQEAVDEMMKTHDELKRKAEEIRPESGSETNAEAEKTEAQAAEVPVTEDAASSKELVSRALNSESVIPSDALTDESVRSWLKEYFGMEPEDALEQLGYELDESSGDYVTEKCGKSLYDKVSLDNALKRLANGEKLSENQRSRLGVWRNPNDPDRPVVDIAFRGDGRIEEGMELEVDRGVADAAQFLGLELEPFPMRPGDELLDLASEKALDVLTKPEVDRRGTMEPSTKTGDGNRKTSTERDGEHGETYRGAASEASGKGEKDVSKSEDALPKTEEEVKEEASSGGTGNGRVGDAKHLVLPALSIRRAFGDSVYETAVKRLKDKERRLGLRRLGSIDSFVPVEGANGEYLGVLFKNEKGIMEFTHAVFDKNAFGRNFTITDENGTSVNPFQIAKKIVDAQSGGKVKCGKVSDYIDKNKLDLVSDRVKNIPVFISDEPDMEDADGQYSPQNKDIELSAKFIISNRNNVFALLEHEAQHAQDDKMSRWESGSSALDELSRSDVYRFDNPKEAAAYSRIRTIVADLLDVIHDAKKQIPSLDKSKLSNKDVDFLKLAADHAESELPILNTEIYQDKNRPKDDKDYKFSSAMYMIPVWRKFAVIFSRASRPSHIRYLLADKIRRIYSGKNLDYVAAFNPLVMYSNDNGEIRARISEGQATREHAGMNPVNPIVGQEESITYDFPGLSLTNFWIRRRPKGNVGELFNKYMTPASKHNVVGVKGLRHLESIGLLEKGSVDKIVSEMQGAFDTAFQGVLDERDDKREGRVSSWEIENWGNRHGFSAKLPELNGKKLMLHFTEATKRGVKSSKGRGARGRLEYAGNGASFPNGTKWIDDALANNGNAFVSSFMAGDEVLQMAYPEIWNAKCYVTPSAKETAAVEVFGHEGGETEMGRVVVSAASMPVRNKVQKDGNTRRTTCEAREDGSIVFYADEAKKQGEGAMKADFNAAVATLIARSEGWPVDKIFSWRDWTKFQLSVKEKGRWGKNASADSTNKGGFGGADFLFSLFGDRKLSLAYDGSIVKDSIDKLMAEFQSKANNVPPEVVASVRSEVESAVKDTLNDSYAQMASRLESSLWGSRMGLPEAELAKQTEATETPDREGLSITGMGAMGVDASERVVNFYREKIGAVVDEILSKKGVKTAFRTLFDEGVERADIESRARNVINGTRQIDNKKVLDRVLELCGGRPIKFKSNKGGKMVTKVPDEGDIRHKRDWKSADGEDHSDKKRSGGQSLEWWWTHSGTTGIEKSKGKRSTDRISIDDLSGDADEGEARENVENFVEGIDNRLDGSVESVDDQASGVKTVDMRGTSNTDYLSDDQTLIENRSKIKSAIREKMKGIDPTKITGAADRLKFVRDLAATVKEVSGVDDDTRAGEYAMDVLTEIMSENMRAGAKHRVVHRRSYEELMTSAASSYIAWEMAKRDGSSMDEILATARKRLDAQLKRHKLPAYVAKAYGDDIMDSAKSIAESVIKRLGDKADATSIANAASESARDELLGKKIFGAWRGGFSNERKAANDADIARRIVEGNRMRAVKCARGFSVDELNSMLGMNTIADLVNLGKEGATYANGSQLAKAFRAKFMEFHKPAWVTDEEELADPAARAEYAATVSSWLEEAAKRLTWGARRTSLVRSAERIKRSTPPTFTELDGVVEHMADVISDELKRIDKAGILKSIEKMIDRTSNGESFGASAGKSVNMSDEAYKRTIAPRLQMYWKYAKSTFRMSEETVEREKEKMLKILGGDGSLIDASNPPSELTADEMLERDTAKMRLHALIKYGGLARKDAGEILDVYTNDISRDIASASSEWMERAEARRANDEAITQRLIEGLNPLMNKNGVVRGAEDAAKKMLFWNVPDMFARFAMYFKTDSAAMGVIDDFRRNMSIAHINEMRMRGTYERLMREAVKSATGTDFDDWIFRSLEEKDEYSRFSRSGWTVPKTGAKTVDVDMDGKIVKVRLAVPKGDPSHDAPQRTDTRLSMAQLIYIYAARKQADMRVNNIAFGFTDEVMRDLERTIGPEGIRLADALSSVYTRVRGDLSAVSERVTGLPVQSPDEKYHPLVFEQDKRVANGMRFSMSTYPSFLMRRKNHDYSNLMEADIGTVFVKRINDAARWSAFAELADGVRTTLCDPRVVTMYYKALGRGAAEKMYEQLNDSFTGGVDTSSGFGAGLRSFVTTVTLGYNPSSAIKQLEGIGGWSVSMNPTRWAISLFQNFDFSNDMLADGNELRASGIFETRKMEGISEPIAALMSAKKATRSNAVMNLLRSYRNNSQAMTVFTDGIASHSCATAYYSGRKRFYMDAKRMSEADAARAALADTDYAIQIGQQSSRPEFLHDMQRGGVGGRLLTQFVGPSIVRFGLELEAAHRAFMVDRTPKAFAAFASKFFAGHVICPTMLSFATQVCTHFLGDRNKDNGEFWDGFLQNLYISMITGPLSGLAFYGQILDAQARYLWSKSASGGSVQRKHYETPAASKLGSLASIASTTMYDTVNMFSAKDCTKYFDAVLKEDIIKLSQAIFPALRLINVKGNIERDLKRK